MIECTPVNQQTSQNKIFKMIFAHFFLARFFFVQNALSTMVLSSALSSGERLHFYKNGSNIFFLDVRILNHKLNMILRGILIMLYCSISHASMLRWNESFTTLWKDCKNPGYTNSMVVHHKL